jgi:hypothetical protein
MEAIPVVGQFKLIHYRALATNSVLVPFAGAGILTPAQIYPGTAGANLGTPCT